MALRTVLEKFVSFPVILNQGIGNTSLRPSVWCKNPVRPISNLRAEDEHNEPVDSKNSLEQVADKEDIYKTKEEYKNYDTRLPLDNKTQNLNASGFPEGKTDNLSMDIFVAVNVIPNSSGSKESGQDDQSKVCALSAGDNRTLLQANSTIDQEKIFEELREVYLAFKDNKNLDAILQKQIHHEISEELREMITEAKKMYFKSLTEHRPAEKIPKIEESGEGEKKVPPAIAQPMLKPHDFLGIRTVYGDLLRPFSTTSCLLKKEDCDKAKKLPCLMATELSKVKAEKQGGKGTCEKFCMPCCKPARDPPICFYPFHKPKCVKKRPPRPAFSECKLIFAMKPLVPCECVRAIKGSCKKSKESAKCGK